MKQTQTIIILACVLALGGVDAATLQLHDGSRLEGRLLKIDAGVVHFETGFAGVLEIPQAQVAGISSAEAVNLRLASGEVLQGPVNTATDGRMEVRSVTGTSAAPLSSVVTGWAPTERDPQLVAADKAADELRRSWAYSLGFDLTGSSGNTRSLGTGLRFSAVLEGPADRLRFYGSYLYQEDNDVRTKDQQIGGVRYTNFFTSHMGWFVRQELERDYFQGISFRSTTAAGLTYKFINEPRMSLEGSLGISYRYEDYIAAGQDSDGFPSLDAGLVFGWQFADWGRLNSLVNYLPSVDDFAEYLLEHESSVDMPLGNSDFWVLRLGVNNKYNSAPTGGRKKLDNTYFVRLILNWK